MRFALRVRESALAELELAVQLIRVGGKVTFLPESQARTADLECRLGRERLFVEITARGINAKRALEIGMAIGYTSLHLARAVGADGLVVTIDPSDEMIAAAEGYLTRAGMRERVRIERGKALDVIPQLRDTFDLIFIDAVKEEYADYLKLSLPHLRTGGVVIVDNLLWGGQVAGEIRSLDQESSTNALREFNKYFVNHPKLRAEVLPVGDGLGYAVKVS